MNLLGVSIEQAKRTTQSRENFAELLHRQFGGRAQLYNEYIVAWRIILLLLLKDMHQYLPAFDLKNSPSVFYAMETAAAVVSTREKKEVPL